MKTLLAIREQDYAWTREAFPSIHPLLLPLCNKPFIEFLIDFAILTKSKAIRLLSDGQLSAVEAWCGNGSRWGIPVSYGSLHDEDCMNTLIDKNRRFCEKERVMVISGFNFIRYDKRQDYAGMANALPDGDWANCSGGAITLAGSPQHPEGRAPEAPPVLSLIPLDTMASYFTTSMETLETGADHYVLPGYGGEPGCAIGRNVVISKSVEIKKPVSIGNNVQLQSGSVIGPSTIIGSNVIIDRASSVSSSIILDNTYLGEHLEVNGRIASGNLLTEPLSGVSIAMEDPHLLSGISQNSPLRSLPRKIVHALAAALLLMLLCIPYLLLWPPLRLTGRWKSKALECLSSSGKQNLTLNIIELTPSGGTLSALAGALSLDRFAMLFRVMAGQLSLIGSTPAEAASNTPDLRAGKPLYRPGVFSYAEAEEWPTSGSERAIVERFHLAHSTALQDVTLTLKAFFNRLHEKSTS
jgi:hypothetical protein